MRSASERVLTEERRDKQRILNYSKRLGKLRGTGRGTKEQPYGMCHKEPGKPGEYSILEETEENVSKVREQSPCQICLKTENWPGRHG